MIDKIVASLDEALQGITDGATVLVAGHGNAGSPQNLLFGLLDKGVRDLTIVANNAGTASDGIGSLIGEGRVRKMVCSYPRTMGAVWFKERYKAGQIELDLVPQGTLTECIRAGGAGIGGFYTPTGVGTRLAEGKEVRVLNGREYVLELPIRGDFALLKAHRADRWGNLVYRKSARNYNPSMAMAAHVTVVEVDEVVDLGELDPEVIVTPGIFIDRVIQLPWRADIR